MDSSSTQFTCPSARQNKSGGKLLIFGFTPGRRQLKTYSTIDERGSKVDRNSVFDCHLSPAGRQIAIENTVSIDF